MSDLIDIAALSGLSEAAAAQRLQKEGYNELPASRKRSVLSIALEVIREPMFFSLLPAG